MSEAVVLVTQQGGVMQLTLNRPERLNTFNELLHAQLLAALNEAQTAPQVRVVVITGAGRGFCAGQDLNDRKVAVGDAPPDLGYTLDTFYRPLITTISNHRCPIIAAVNGVAAGSGASLALACDMVIAAESASFIQAFSKIGLIPDAGSTYFLPRALGTARAVGLALTGDKLSATQAAQWGMIWKCVSDASLQSEVEALAQQLAAAPPLAMQAIKETLRASAALALPEALALEITTQRRLGKSEDYREGVRAFMEKRTPTFTGK